jgi:short-subunit dehydrogenase
VKVQLVLPAATATDIWELSGVPMSALAEGTIMAAEDCVDAALAGLDLGEPITLPSVNDAALLATFVDASAKLFGASQTSKPAARYLATA